MYRNGKWANQIRSLQEPDGKWGWFHSLSRFSASPITTEQALRRLQRLGCSMEDDCIKRAVSYMDDCLAGRNTIPDRREKTHDWDIFTAMILSAWIRAFTPDNENANKVAGQWAKVVSRALESGAYDHGVYVTAFQDTFGIVPYGGRLKDFTSFYQLSLLRGCLDPGTERTLLDHVLKKPDGIYYVYEHRLLDLPACFESRTASRYLAAVELLSGYGAAGEKLGFVRDWLMANRKEDGTWDMGSMVNDKVYFPLSDDWRKKQARIADCTTRISALLACLEERK